MEFLIGLLMGLVFLGCGLYIAVMYITMLMKGKASLNWPSCQGEIIQSKKDLVMGYDVEVIDYYKYIIDGKEFIGDKIFFKYFDFDEVDYQNKYLIGKKVTVYYNPKNYTEAVLINGVPTQIHLIIVYFLFCVIVFLIIVLNL